MASYDRALHAILATRLVLAIRTAADYRNRFNSEYLPDLETMSKMFPPPLGTVEHIDEVEMIRISNHGDRRVSEEIIPTRRSGGEGLRLGEDEEGSGSHQTSSGPFPRSHTVES
jgi:hypothetical protein